MPSIPDEDHGDLRGYINELHYRKNPEFVEKNEAVGEGREGERCHDL